MRYTDAEIAAAKDLEASALKMPNHRDGARIKAAALMEARAILMGQPPERIAQLDRRFMESFR